jgi:hypothetical protein
MVRKSSPHDPKLRRVPAILQGNRAPELDARVRATDPCMTLPLPPV